MLIELLFDKLRKHGRIQELLSQTTDLPEEDLVNSLIEEFEHVLERYKGLSDYAAQSRERAKRIVDPQLKLSREVPLPLTTHQYPTLQVEPIRISSVAVELKLPERKAFIRETQSEEERKEDLRKKLSEVEHRIQSEIRRDWDCRANEIYGVITRLKNSHIVLQKELEAIESAKNAQEKEEPKLVDAISMPPSVNDISDNDILYLHGVSAAHSGAANGLLSLDENGIIGKKNLFVYRAEGLSFLVSKLASDSMNVTKQGMLLLNKNDSLKFHAVHEQLLNAFRCSDSLLPFEFGTIVRGKEEFARRVEREQQRLHKTIVAEVDTKVWTVRLSVLDDQIAEIVSREEKTVPINQRGRESTSKGKRFDVKSLEKVLQLETKTAEAIHEILSARAQVSAIQSLVGFGSGTSKDWKVILDASYEVEAGKRKEFFLEVYRLEKEYAALGILIAVSGVAGNFSFHPEAPCDSQTISA